MMLSRVPQLEEHLAELREIGPSGLVIAFNVSWIGPEFLHNEFPQDWRDEYESYHYAMFDPIFHWIRKNTGIARWSEVDLPDVRSVNEKAKKHGLVYGAIACRKTSNGRSFITVGRADRELTGDELKRLDDIMVEWVAVVHERPPLSSVEIETLSLVRNGLAHKDIALELGISVGTVKKRLRRVRSAFKSKTISEAVSIATQKRYFGPK